MGLDQLARASGAKKEDVRLALDNLRSLYKGRGIVILEKDGAHQFATSPDNASHIEEFIKGEFSAELSKAALETLAIIAYKGPLTRVDIEYVRGVNSSFILRNLMMRGIIERIENPKDARSYLYRVSFDFLKHFGLTSVEELPQFKEFKEKKIEFAEEKPQDSEETSHAGKTE